MTHDDHSVDGARRAAERADLDGWVRSFLRSPGSDNPDLADELTRSGAHWLGPVRLPLHRLHRLAGPEGDPVLIPVGDEYWDDRVPELADKVERGFEPPPLIVTYRDGQLVLEDGNHRVEGLRHAGADEVWAVVRFADNAARERYLGADWHAGP